MKKKIKLPFLFSKWFHFEFWPFWIFYIPMFGYGIFLAIKAHSFAYFTATNPAMKYGGAFGMDKIKILNLINKKYTPKGFLFRKDQDDDEFTNLMKIYDIDFPIVCKPNVGERGIGVEKLDNELDFKKFISKHDEDILIQEFIDYPIELGVFYHRYPISKKDGITSVVHKEFLSIIGNGRSKFGELVKENIRARSRISYLKRKYNSKWKQVIPAGISYKLEPIGNHNRGTKFLDGNHLINDQLIEVFREISKPLDGYYYGRFDIKVKSINDLYEGTSALRTATPLTGSNSANKRFFAVK